MELEVYKFGGTSLCDGERIRSAARLVKRCERPVVTVVSAPAGMTDALARALAEASSGNWEESRAILGDLEEQVRAIASDLASAEAEAVQPFFDECSDLLSAVSRLSILPPSVRDRILAGGEKISARLLASVLSAGGAFARPFDADAFLETDGPFGDARPLPEIADRRIAALLRPALESCEYPVVTGFIGRGSDGATTTLGRGGSDFSATIIAAALEAVEVTIWTDVDGVYTADPGIVAEARLLGRLHYREAAELSHYGAKVLHQRTMIPVTRKAIPVRIRNSFHPDCAGTVVDRSHLQGAHPVKAISAVSEHALISVEGKGMAGVRGIAARVFRALARAGISVTMISQGSSESSITMALRESQMDAGEMALRRELAREILRGDVEEIRARPRVSLVAIVGLGMAATPGVAARIFRAVAAAGVNVLAIAQGASELSVTLAVDAKDKRGAVAALHREFRLHLAEKEGDPGPGPDLMLLGCGSIAREFLEQLDRERDRLYETRGLAPVVVGIADRGGYAADPAGFSRRRLREILDRKMEGRSVGGGEGGRAGGTALEMVKHLLGFRLARPVLLDLSDADDAYASFLEALGHGADVVTANKKPLAGAQGEYDRLVETARASSRRLLAEATVGAGLPIVDSLRQLVETGDRIVEMRGSLSGTLGFLLSRMEQGAALSEALAEAIASGYTEPDPWQDIGGLDVARKARILARLAGFHQAAESIDRRGLLPDDCQTADRERIIEEARKHDDAFRSRLESARSRGFVLRYAATVTPDRAEVGLEEVAEDSPLGRLQGTDSMVVFRTERYGERPLVIAGPGAGPEVTAMAVFSDLLRLFEVKGA